MLLREAFAVVVGRQYYRRRQAEAGWNLGTTIREVVQSSPHDIIVTKLSDVVCI